MRFAKFIPMSAALTLTALSAATPATAHHSFALFDVEKHVMLEGKVKKFEWTNPHSWITLEVAGINNQPEEWMIELPAAAALVREGWNKNFVKAGERISVRINPLKNGAKGGALEGFTPDPQ